MKRHALLAMLLAMLLAALRAASSSAGDFTVLTDEVQGEVRVVGTDRPASRVTLSISDKGEVVADDEGRFRWPISRGSNVTAGPGPNQGLFCRVYAHDTRDWTWELVGGDSTPSDHDRQQAREQLSAQARSHWIVRDGKPWLIVECPPLAEVEVKVPRPDGGPVVDRPVRVFPSQARDAYHTGSSVRFAGRTDAEGRFRMRCFEGKRRLRIIVPGVGFGSTGLLEVVAARVTSPELPRLARLASVQGTLDPSLARPGTSVEATHGTDGVWGAGVWDRVKAVCDDRGQFVLADLVPGSLTISLSQAGKSVKVEPGTLRLNPGQAESGLLLRPKPPRRPAGTVAEEPRPLGRGRAHDPKEEFVWLEGTIRDESGRPLRDTVVYARTAYHGGIRMYEDVRKTTADALGRYQIKGPVWEFMDAVTLVAFSGDRPPAVAYAPAPSAEVVAGRPPLDIALAPRGGLLRVAVIRDGKPLPGAQVRLQADGVAGLTQWAAESPLGGSELDPRFYPKAQAGADGVASFTNLFPGTYQIIANDDPRPLGPGAPRWPHSPEPPLGVGEDVGVAAGQEVKFSVAIHPQPSTARFRVLRPGGAPVTNQSVAFSFGLRSPTSSTSLELDEQGIGTYTFSSPGLWAVDVRFLEVEMKSIPVDEEPYHQAQTLVPVSPGLPLDEPVLLQGVRHDRGSLRARLLDGEGRPARGSLMIVNGPGPDPTGIMYAGTTDDQGEVRFPDLPSGDYELRGAVDGLKPPFDPGPSGSYPEDDDALKGAVAVVELSTKVEAGTEVIAELRARPVGYLRGTIHPPTGKKASDYDLSFDIDRPWLPTPYRLDPETGRFTLGPLPAGRRTIKVHKRTTEGPWPVVGTYEVEVSGGVARLVVHPVEEPGAAASAPSGQSGKVMLGMGGLSQEGAAPRGPGGTVRLNDGQVPAFAARALLLVPGQDQPVASGVSDAAGNLTWRGRWTAGGGPARGDGKPVDKPKAVVWQPGLRGAAIVEVEPGQPIRAVLPRPLAAAGRVTLGGRPALSRNARGRVIAAHRGRGSLDAALSLEASVQSDGHFDFRGLTPGRYQVQAARDGIWLSLSVEMSVEEGKATPDLVLDIPEPGATVIVEVADRQGRPVAGRTITLDRPEGPLASLWPRALRTDGVGKLILRGLEAGDHSLRIEGEPGHRQFQVPETRGDTSRVEVVRLINEKSEP